MAQTEDTELTDLVMEALEKNGSLAKIRALLRANIFLAFEDECENVRHNMSLDNVLKIPEGIYALSIVHEFLEFCNLKNTLFVYKSESRQGKEYKIDGKKFLYNKLNLNKMELTKEPILLTLLKNCLKQNYHNNINVTQTLKKNDDSGDNNSRDDINSSYIVHEDSQSSATNSCQSDNSIDEKNKLHLRLQLDNSDTDTSTDSSRGKSASEYKPSEHVVDVQKNNISKESISKHHIINNTNTNNVPHKPETVLPTYLSKVTGTSSSDSTSYVELKPFSSIDKRMINTSGLPPTEIVEEQQGTPKNLSDHSKIESIKSATLSSASSFSIKNDSHKEESVNKLVQELAKSDGETPDYSFDFSGSQGSKKDRTYSKEFIKELNKNSSTVSPNRKSPLTSPNQHSHSSISISDVADLISDKSSSLEHPNIHGNSPEKSKLSSNSFKIRIESHKTKLNSDDSGDFSESPIPSLSNLSLDIHSD